MPINGIETAYKDRYTFAPLLQRAVPIQWYTLPLRFIQSVRGQRIDQFAEEHVDKIHEPLDVSNFAETSPRIGCSGEFWSHIRCVNGVRLHRLGLEPPRWPEPPGCFLLTRVYPARRGL